MQRSRYLFLFQAYLEDYEHYIACFVRQNIRRPWIYTVYEINIIQNEKAEVQILRLISLMITSSVC